MVKRERGRPRVGRDAKVSFYTTQMQKRALFSIAKRRGMSVTELMVDVVDRFLKSSKHEKVRRK